MGVDLQVSSRARIWFCAILARKAIGIAMINSLLVLNCEIILLKYQTPSKQFPIVPNYSVEPTQWVMIPDHGEVAPIEGYGAHTAKYCVGCVRYRVAAIYYMASVGYYDFSECEPDDFWCNEELFDYLKCYYIGDEEDVQFILEAIKTLSHALVRHKTRMEDLKNWIAQEKKKLEEEKKKFQEMKKRKEDKITSTKICGKYKTWRSGRNTCHKGDCTARKLRHKQSKIEAKEKPKSHLYLISPRCHLKDEKKRLDNSPRGGPGPMGIAVQSEASHLHTMTSSSCLLAAAPAQAYFVCPVEGRAKYCSAQAPGKVREALHTAVLYSALNRANRYACAGAVAGSKKVDDIV
ncbi:unnamed protein product [Ranitomeya imitator]|uniref:Uncharacterized protein n=1 Tax=Ranitomeya imitator TaxID=111125 RepID=A0ABN9L7Y6_9NEOB|nr:unnamed protein product [Ranitomeya imitator]